jgi:hypothetical protein
MWISQPSPLHEWDITSKCAAAWPAGTEEATLRCKETKATVIIFIDSNSTSFSSKVFHFPSSLHLIIPYF